MVPTRPRARRALNTAKRLLYDNQAKTVDSVCVPDTASSCCASRTPPTRATTRHSARLTQNARIYSSPLRTRGHGSSVIASNFASLTTSRHCLGATAEVVVGEKQRDKPHLTMVNHATLKDRPSSVRVSGQTSSERPPRCNWPTVTSSRQLQTSTDNKPPDNVKLKKKKEKRNKPNGSVLTMIITSHSRLYAIDNVTVSVSLLTVPLAVSYNL